MPEEYDQAIDLENEFRVLATEIRGGGGDPRLVAIAVTQAELAFMALRKAVFFDNEKEGG